MRKNTTVLLVHTFTVKVEHHDAAVAVTSHQGGRGRQAKLVVSRGGVPTARPHPRGSLLRHMTIGAIPHRLGKN